MGARHVSPGDNLPLLFKRDHHLRRLFFTEETFQHKARVNLFWLAWLLDQTTDSHDLVLDPMGGAGSILFAATKQRPVLTGDVELQWVQLQAVNALRICTQMFFSAPAYVAQWDVANLPFASGSIPSIVTSPPYYDLFSDWNRKSGHQLDGPHVGKSGLCYGFHARQLGNIHVYENYLRAMRRAYQECWRVLRPGGALVLIVGDRVKNRRIVPITDDTSALCQSNGFDLVGEHQRYARPSQYRNIHIRTNGDDYPVIDVETALVLQKQNSPDIQPKRRFVLVEAPSPDSSPGRQLFKKQLAYAHANADHVIILTKAGLTLGHAPNAIWAGGHERKARARKDWAFGLARQLIKHGLVAGDEIELHVTLRYATYLQQRLNSFGARCTIPTARCNLGQKLAWYTKAQSVLLEQGQARFRSASGCHPAGGLKPVSSFEGPKGVSSGWPKGVSPDVESNATSARFENG